MFWNLPVTLQSNQNLATTDIVVLLWRYDGAQTVSLADAYLDAEYGGAWRVSVGDGSQQFTVQQIPHCQLQEKCSDFNAN